MTPRPFYRSRLFWLGLPGLVFLLWAWVDSFSHWAGVGVSSSGWAGIGSCQGTLYVAKEAWVVVKLGSPEAFYQRLPDVVDMLAGWRGSELVEFHSVPYAAVVLAYVAAWLLTLAWWQRRKSRLLKLHSAP